MIRPFVWTLFFMIAGIIVGQSASVMHFALFAIIVVVLCVVIAWHFKSKIPIIFVLFFLLGNILITNSLKSRRNAESICNNNRNCNRY